MKSFTLARFFAAPLALAIAGLLAGNSLPASVSAQTRALPPASAFPDLIAGLKSTPGCLGVETARTASGKQVIFGWFENKAALLKWYYSDAHVQSMALGGGKPSKHPMPDLPDDGQPIMAIASVTLAQSGEAGMAISQIAIELYRPAPGGLAGGGSFAPAGLQVPGLRRFPMTPPPVRD